MNSNSNSESKFARVFIEAQRIREKQEVKHQEQLAKRHLETNHRKEKKEQFLK